MVLWGWRYERCNPYWNWGHWENRKRIKEQKERRIEQRAREKGEMTAEIQKIYPNAIVMYFSPALRDPTQPMLFAGQET